MSYQPHYITSFEDDAGLSTFYEPFLINEKSMPVLEDAFCWRGKVLKRRGFTNIGRLRRQIVQSSLTPTDGTAVYTNADILSSNRTNEPQAELQPTNVSITIDRSGSITTYKDDGNGGLTMSAGGTYTISSGTVNYATGKVKLNFTVSPANGKTVDATFFYYPGLPVMGLPNNVTTSLNIENLRAFDTIYSYQFNLGQFEELGFPLGTSSWNGKDSDLFWTTTYWPHTGIQKFWATNFNNSATPDPLQYYDTKWNTFTPALDGTSTNKMFTCLAIVPYKDRLLAFNTWETVSGGVQTAAVQFPQRLRYSQLGDPTVANSWRSDVPGYGGFIDIPTSEEIVSVEFIKDVLLVKCERSSWKVIYTGNKSLPFIFEKINTELGASSTFALVPFDRGVYSVGNIGIMVDDSVNVQRIDLKIPDQIFKISNDNTLQGAQRVYGIRNYQNQLVYWAYPEANNPVIKFPNQVLVFNYVNQSWAIFNDSYTCFGYYQPPNSQLWGNTFTTWGATNSTWGSGSDASYIPNIVAGNQQGFVQKLNDEQIENDISLAINSITGSTFTSANHNMEEGTVVTVSGAIGSTGLNDNTFLVELATVNDNTTFQLHLWNGTAFEDAFFVPGGTYMGLGRMTIIQNINIVTKIFGAFYENGKQVRLGYIDFLLDKTTDGELSCNVYVDESQLFSMSNPSVSVNEDDQPTSGLWGNNTLLTSPENDALYPFQKFQNKIWHKFFVQTMTQNFQVQLTMTPEQLAANDVEDVVLHAMTIYLSPEGRLTP